MMKLPSISKSAWLAVCLLGTGCSQFIAATSGPGLVGASEGERTLSQRVEDISIEKTAAINFYKLNPEFRDAHILIMSFFGNVLLAGQVPRAELARVAESSVKDMREVRSVHNELTVGDPSPYLTRAKDGVISARIGTALTFAKDFPSSQCKVLVEDGVVYLMAKLKRTDAERAERMVLDTPDVKKLVKLVDYLPE